MPSASHVTRCGPRAMAARPSVGAREGHWPGHLAQGCPGRGTVGEGQVACKAHSLFLRPRPLWTNRIRRRKRAATGSPHTVSPGGFTSGDRPRHSEPTTSNRSPCDSQERSVPVPSMSWSHHENRDRRTTEQSGKRHTVPADAARQPSLDGA